MAKLPTRQDLGALPIDGSRRPIANASVPSSAGVGAGVVSLGQSFEKLGRVFDKELDEREQYEYANAIADLNKHAVDLDTKYLNDADYSSRPERYMGDMDSFVTERSTAIENPRIKNRFLAQAGAIAARHGHSQAEYARRQGNADAVAKLDELAEYYIRTAATSPDANTRAAALTAFRAKADTMVGIGAYTPSTARLAKNRFEKAFNDARIDAAKSSGDLDVLEAEYRAMPDAADRTLPSGLRDEVKRFEGFRPRAYSDFKQNSIGYGTRERSPGEVITREEAETRLDEELQKAADFVDSVNPNLPAGAKAALTSLTYNAGGDWANAGLGEAVKAGDLERAKERFVRYTSAGGKPLPALEARRAQEVQWFDDDSERFAPDSNSSAAEKHRLLQKLDQTRRIMLRDQMAADAAAKRQESLDAANEEMSIIKKLADPKTAADVTFKSIATNSVFNRTNEAGLRHMKGAEAALRAYQRDIVDRQERSLGEAFLPLFNRIHSRGDDRISDKGEFAKYLDGGGLYYNGYEKLMREWDRVNGGGDEKDKSINTYKTNLLNEAKQRILKGGDTFMPDPGAQRQFNQFVIDLDNALDGVKDPQAKKDLLTPSHGSYFGKVLDEKDGKPSPYVRSLSDRFGSVGDRKGMADRDAINRAMQQGTATESQVKAALQGGLVDRDAAYNYGLSRGWFGANPTVQVPVSR